MPAPYSFVSFHGHKLVFFRVESFNVSFKRDKWNGAIGECYILLKIKSETKKRPPVKEVQVMLRTSSATKKRPPVKEVSFIIWHRAIFPGLKTKYCNRYEA